MFLHNRRFRLTVLAAALAAVLPAFAQPAFAQQTAPVVKPQPAEPAAIQKVEVKGAADSYDARRDDTASKIVLNHEEIIKFGDTNVLDVLKRLPGVTVSGASGRGGGEVRMRGLGSGYTQVLINGERAPAGFSMDSLAPDAIERIEVLRAATAEFSTQSIAGTINIVLKKAIKTAQRELKLSVGAGADTLTPTANLQMSDRKGALSYSLTVNGVHQKFDRDTPVEEVETDGAGVLRARRMIAYYETGTYDGLNIGPRLNWTFANGDTLTSQSFFNYGRFKRLFEATTSAFPSSATGPYPYLDWDMENVSKNFRSDLNWVKKLADGAKLDVKLGGFIGRASNASYRQGYTAKNGALTLDSDVKSILKEHGYTSTGKYSVPLGQGHALSAGWDGGYTTRYDMRLQAEKRAKVLNAQDPAPGFVDFPADERYTADITRFAGYAQDEWNVTPQWSVYMGVRWEGIWTAVSGNHFKDSKSRTSVWSPLFQTLYKIPGTKGDQLRFALTRTYKAPSADRILPRRWTSPDNKNPNAPDLLGNPDLKPELATGIDAAYEHYWAKGAMVSVSASMRRLTDYTRTSVLPEADGTYVSKPVNDGTANTRGLEFEAKFPLTAVFEKGPAIDLRLNMSRNWSSVSAVGGPNNRLDQQTPFSATLGADYKMGSLTTGASYSFRNGGPVRVSATQDAYTTPRRDLEMYGLWKFSAKNQLRVGLTNILAQEYISETTYTYLNGSGASRRRTFTPGEAVLRLTMEMKF